MPYAADGNISTTPIPGGVEITEKEYRDLLAEMMNGKVIVIVNGAPVAQEQTPEAEPPVAPEPVVEPLTQEQLRALVDEERDRRIADTFFFGGVNYQLDPTSQDRITAMGASARFAVLDGALVGNLKWADPTADFGWIATDNSVTPMDAPTMIAFSEAAKVWLMRHVYAAHALKAGTVPADPINDTYWPAAS